MSIQGLSSADNRILGSRAPRDPFAARAEASEAPEGTLVTLHFSEEMYEGAEKICAYFKGRGFPHIAFDREHGKIHFSYDLELSALFFDSSGSPLAERVMKTLETVMAKKRGSFEKTESGSMVSKPSSEGVRVEMYPEPVEAFTEEALLYFKTENLDAWFKGFLSKLRREMDDEEGDLTQEELREGKAEFLKNAPELLDHFGTASSILSSHSLEELEKLAENVKVTETYSDMELEFDSVSEQVGEEFRRECEAIVRKSTEELTEWAEDAIDARMRDLEREITLRGGSEIEPRAPKLRSSREESKREEVVAPPKKVKQIAKDAIITLQYDGKPEEIIAYNLKKAGILTPEKFEAHKRCMQEGAALLKAFQKRDFKIEERAVQAPQKAQERSMAGSKASTRALFRSLLQTAPGLCLGENHDEIDTVKLLVDNMSKLPVKFLFLEGFSTALQPLFDAYLETGNMPAFLKCMLIGDGSGKRSDPAYSMLALVREARGCGVRVVGIENPLSRQAPLVRPFFKSAQHSNFELNRVVTMNYAAAQIIQKMMVDNPGQKFLLLAGAAHLPEFDGIPGLAKILGCPSIAACPSVKEGMERGEFSARSRTNDNFDYFFNPDTTPPLTPEELAAKELKAAQGKIKVVQARVVELQRLISKTDKASRAARPGRYVQLAQLQAKLSRLRS